MKQIPSFDSWTIVFLFAATQGFFTAFVLARWQRGNAQANRLLSCLLVLFSVTLVEYVLFWTGYLYNYPHFANISLQFPFLYGPILWLYLRTSYTGKPLKKQDAWHFAAFGISIFLMAGWYLADTATKQSQISGKTAFPWNFWLMQVQFWARKAWLVGYAFWNWIYITRQPRIGSTARWARLLVGFYMVFVLAYISYFILIRFSFFNTQWDYHISAVMTAMIYLIAYSGYAQPAVFNGFQWTEPAAPAKYRNSGLTPEASRSLLQSLKWLMQEEMLYHDAEINLDKLAARLNASKHHLSQVINAELGTTFFDYINQLRVEEAKKLLMETTRQDFHIIEIAFMVGFNNKVSFNAAFKKATGMTPTAYRRSHGKSDQQVGPASAGS